MDTGTERSAVAEFDVVLEVEVMGARPIDLKPGKAEKRLALSQTFSSPSGTLWSLKRRTTCT